MATERIYSIPTAPGVYTDHYLIADKSGNSTAVKVLVSDLIGLVSIPGSNVSTNANGAASAGQKVITVDSTTGFLQNAPIAYTLVSGVSETNVVDTVDSPTQLTCTTNIGATGIPDNGYIVVINPGTLVASGAVTGATATQQRLVKGAFLGGNASLVGDDSALLIGRSAVNPLASGGSHGVRDESTYYYAAGGYASFDSNPTAGGASGMNHLASFQSRPYYNGVGTMDAMYGFDFLPTISGPITNVYGAYVIDPLGAGTIDFMAGLYVAPLTRGTANYGIYVEGNNPCYFGGIVQTGGNLTAGGNILAANFRSNAATNSILVGSGVQTADVYYGTALGHNAAHSLSSGQRDVLVGGNSGYAVTSGNNNTMVGHGTGLVTTTGSGHIFLGHSAGSYETGSNKLFIDNQDRSTDEADARANAIVYGVMAAAKANQEIQFNVGKMGFFATAAVAKPTGVAVSAAGVHAALVTLGLIAA